MMQFSPTSEHILLAYGRRHGSLLKSIVIDGETTLPIYTVLEVRTIFFFFFAVIVLLTVRDHFFPFLIFSNSC